MSLPRPLGLVGWCYATGPLDMANRGHPVQITLWLQRERPPFGRPFQVMLLAPSTGPGAEISDELPENVQALGLVCDRCTWTLGYNRECPSCTEFRRRVDWPDSEAFAPRPGDPTHHDTHPTP